MLRGAEKGFSAALKNFGYAGLQSFGDDLVRVQNGSPKHASEPGGDGGFSHSHEADQDDVFLGGGMVRDWGGICFHFRVSFLRWGETGRSAAILRGVNLVRWDFNTERMAGQQKG